MRVQHNIAALNSYRNYNNNTKAINKNLEKLSSGYKINRAGDDAAGLAISEKMRAQITGLEGAQKNAKDGISLVQTAEGALTEVHSMLNRMYSLAEQSANGTYEGLDRDQLQKEVGKLRDEINRIADSSNFNGIKLLDGSMNGSGSGSKVVLVSATSGVNGAISDADDQAQSVQTATYSAIAGKFNDGDSFTVSLELDNGAVYRESYTISKKSAGGAELKLSDGTTSSVSLTAETGVTAAEWGKLVKEIYDKNESLQETLTVNDAGTTFTGVSNSFSTPTVKSINLNGGKVNVSAQVVDTTEGKGYYQKLDAKQQLIYKGNGSVRKEDAVFSVNGVEFAFVENAAAAKALGSNVNTVTVATGDNPAAADVTKMIDLINQKTGLNIKDNATPNGVINLYSRGSNGSTGGLTLQIGDTADSYNKLSVAIEDMHASAMGIGGIDISGQSGAQSAMNAIKSAINYVSETRGTLGATQNRLEHTINNLSVMQENIQDAESTIRDTDVADEMMKYTKNSILVQSAQAMLAQANQQPQGVLQLLQ